MGILVDVVITLVFVGRGWEQLAGIGGNKKYNKIRINSNKIVFTGQNPERMDSTNEHRVHSDQLPTCERVLNAAMTKMPFFAFCTRFATRLSVHGVGAAFATSVRVIRLIRIFPRFLRRGGGDCQEGGNNQCDKCNDSCDDDGNLEVAPEQATLGTMVPIIVVFVFRTISFMATRTIGAARLGFFVRHCFLRLKVLRILDVKQGFTLALALSKFD